MADRSLKIYVSPLSTQFTEAGTTVDVQIYKLEGNDGWTLEIGIDDDTSIAWTQSFPDDQSAWDEFVQTVEAVSLKKLLEADGEEATVH